MANGEGMDAAFWERIGAGAAALGALLAGWLGGFRRGKMEMLEIDSAKTSVSLEASREEFRDEHEKTRALVLSIVTALREEREAMVALVRAEGKENRAALYALGSSITARVEQLHRDLIDRTRGNGPRQ